MRKPSVQRINIAQVRGELDTLITLVSQNEARVLVEADGSPVAALVSAADLDRLDRLDRERGGRFRVIDEARDVFKDVSPEEIDREADRAVSELRTAASAKA